MAELGTVEVDVRGDFDGFQRQTKSRMSKIGALAGKAFFAGFAIKKGLDVIGGAINAAEFAGSLDSITAQLVENQRKAGTGFGFTAEKIDDLTKSISKQTGVQDELVQEGANVLLSYQAIQDVAGENNDIFTRALKINSDVATVMGTDLRSGANQLGKALENPKKGMNALSRAGITFTDAQKEQITALQESGDLLGAQDLLLSAVEQNYAGTAAASANATAKIGLVWNELQESIGRAFLPVIQKVANFMLEKVLPIFENMGDFLAPVREFFTGSGEAAEGFLGKFRPAIQGVIRIGKRFINAIKSNADTFKRIWDEIVAFIGPVFDQIVEIQATALELMTVVIETALSLWAKFWDIFGETIIKRVMIIWNTIKGVISGALDVIQGIIETFIGIFTGDWERAWDGVKQIFSGGVEILVSIVRGARDLLFEAVRFMWDAAWNFLKELPGKVVSIGVDMMKGIANGIKNAAGSIIDSIKRWVIDRIPGWAKRFLGISSPSTLFMGYGEDLMTGMAMGIEKGRSDIDRALGRVAGASASIGFDATTMARGLNVTNVFNAPVGGSMAEFAREIAAEGAREMRFNFA